MRADGIAGIVDPSLRPGVRDHGIKPRVPGAGGAAARQAADGLDVDVDVIAVRIQLTDAGAVHEGAELVYRYAGCYRDAHNPDAASSLLAEHIQRTTHVLLNHAESDSGESPPS